MRWPRHPEPRIIVSPEDIEWLGQWEWTVNSNGYVCRYDGRKMILLHRLITDAQPGEEVHHLNANALDNRRENLQKMSSGEHAAIHSRPRWKGGFLNDRNQG